jgi:LAO/AO transport system kinase
VSGTELGRRLAAGDRTAAPAALNILESTAPADREQACALLEEVSPARMGREAPGHIVGITGPPGAGKSTLLSALIRHLRKHGRNSMAVDSIATLAVDPSSRRSGGSLLGDRTRIGFDPSENGVFIRSTAAGERLGGLARGTRAAAQALAAAFDVVLIETVGVGQAETEVAEVADTVVVVVQPGSGDVLQFLKSGIMEIPDVLVVTKSDLGKIALAAQRDLHAALRSLGNASTPVIAVSSLPPIREFDRLAGELERSRTRKDVQAHREHARRMGALTEFIAEYGQRALRALGGRARAERLLAELDPTSSEPELETALVTELERQRTA